MLQQEIADLSDVFFHVFLQDVPNGVLVMREEQSVTRENIQVELRAAKKRRYQGWVNEHITRYRCKD